MVLNDAAVVLHAEVSPLPSATTWRKSSVVLLLVCWWCVHACCDDGVAVLDSRGVFGGDEIIEEDAHDDKPLHWA